ncbi:hypothetical protein, partial [Flavonifractor plautii]|uniref:hypothetical protein n=1 Tax=Flavonifractor plautii TaxID=292800 RepID=UPI0032EADE00
IGLLTYLGCKWHSRGQRFDPAYLHQSEESLETKWFQGFPLCLWTAQMKGYSRLHPRQLYPHYDMLMSKKFLFSPFSV